MDRPSADVLLEVARITVWEKAKANLIILASTLPKGSVQRSKFEEVIDQLVNHIHDEGLLK